MAADCLHRRSRAPCGTTIDEFSSRGVSDRDVYTLCAAVDHSRDPMLLGRLHDVASAVYFDIPVNVVWLEDRRRVRQDGKPARTWPRCGSRHRHRSLTPLGERRAQLAKLRV